MGKLILLLAYLWIASGVCSCAYVFIDATRKGYRRTKGIPETAGRFVVASLIAPALLLMDGFRIAQDAFRFYRG